MKGRREDDADSVVEGVLAEVRLLSAHPTMGGDGFVDIRQVISNSCIFLGLVVGISVFHYGYHVSFKALKGLLYLFLEEAFV